MTTQQFIASLEKEEQPNQFNNTLLEALWWDGKGNWTKAHQLVDSLGGEDAAWVHAYLHRKEGDQWNANYWYRRAGRSMPNQSLDEEWRALVEYFVGS